MVSFQDQVPAGRPHSFHPVHSSSLAEFSGIPVSNLCKMRHIDPDKAKQFRVVGVHQVKAGRASGIA